MSETNPKHEGHVKKATPLQANVLIIGKTGVGKSSFINYLFGRDVRETGTGLPVTAAGLFVSSFTLENGLTVNLYDTWGLEADKAEKWESMVMEEVRSHDGSGIREWFHTVIYCLSAKSARVENFEIEQINRLNALGHRVLVVLTHADLAGAQDAVREMTAVLVVRCGLSEADIVKVSSVAKRLLGGRETRQFGRAEAIARIAADLWQHILERIPRQIQAHGDAAIADWYAESEALIDERVTFLVSASAKKLTQLGAEVYESAERSLQEFAAYSDATINEAIDYFRTFLEKSQALAEDETFSFTDAFARGEKGQAIVRGIVLQAPTINLLAPWTWAGDRREELKGYLTVARTKIEEILDAYVDEVRAYLKKIEWQGDSAVPE